MDILVFPYHDWRKLEREGPRGRDSHLINSLIKKEEINKVLIINRPCSRAETLKIRIKKLPDYGSKIEGNNLYKLSKIGDKIYILDFFVNDIFGPLILRRMWWANVFGRKSIIDIINKVQNQYINNPICLTFNPFVYRAISNLNPHDVIYDIFDDFSVHPRFNWLEKREARRGMEYLTSNSKLLITVTHFLLSNFENLSAKVISNGFSSNFLKNIEGNKDFEDLKGIKGRIVGYSGRISRRIDVKLIETLAGNLESINFVFIGEVYDKKWINPLRKFRNIYFLGPKKNEELPYYFSRFDVAIVPHIVDEFERAGDSIKVYEYLASGLPVVSTNIGSLEEFKTVVDISPNHSEFISNLNKYLNNSEHYKSSRYQDYRRKAVIKYTWDSKSNIYLDLLKRFI